MPNPIDYTLFGLRQSGTCLFLLCEISHNPFFGFVFCVTRAKAFKRIWYSTGTAGFSDNLGAQLAALFVGRDVGSRRRTRQGLYGSGEPSRL